MKTSKSVRYLLAAVVAASTLCSVASADVAGGVLRKKVAGIDVIVYRTNAKDVVMMSGSLPAGEVFAGTGNVAVPNMVGTMLDKGTAKEDQFQIAAKLEKVGANINFGVDTQLLSVSGQMLRKDLPMVIDLLAEQLRYPAFSADELKKAKEQFVGGLRQAMEDPDSRAREAFELSIYPPGHPNRPISVTDYLKAAPAVTAGELKAFHARYYGPEHMTLVFVGDVDAAQVSGQIAKAFDGWAGGVDVIRASAPAPKATEAREMSLEIAGKTSASILLGQASGMDYHDPDAIAVRVGTAILGSGFVGRLMATVRDQEGLTYGIRAFAGDDTFSDGMWAVTATFAPDLLEKGIASTRRELWNWWNEGVTADELKARKANMIGGYQVGLTTTAGVAAALNRAANLGYEASWLDEYPKRIDALTLEQVNGAIKNHLDPAKMVLVRAGTLPVDMVPKNPLE